jgi:REP element-mobilizing transposase RayT
MARPLRVEYSGACYHVVGRGNRRNQVFSSDSDYTLFLDKLAGYVELYGAVIYTYCLMPNHYHLFLKTNHANLGKFMQSLITSFTLSMNKKYGQCGHLFQGRYKAQLVETELYKNKLSRYIHLNPVKLKSLESESTADLKKLLRIASHFGVGINGISSNTKRCDEKLLTNKAFRKQSQEIDGLLHENTKAKV